MERVELDPRFSLIAVTGGPCGGKTSFLAIARQLLESHGMRVAVLSEVATEFINAGFSPVLDWEDPIEFQKALLKYILYRESLYYVMLTMQKGNKPLVLLVDRGALDAIAYIGRKQFQKIAEEMGLNLGMLRIRYKAVLHFVTAAEGAEDHYTLANNSARSETPEQARDLDHRTRKAWAGHPRHFIIDNSTDFDGKIHRSLTSLARVLHMPIPKEKERKFLIENFSREALPQDTVSTPIVQDYLTSGPRGEERRVRMMLTDDTPAYYYTIKSDTDEVGVREEREEIITRSRYEELLEERDVETLTIRKVRHTFQHESHKFEVDEYNEPVSDLVICEVEVADMDEHISLTDCLDFKHEITGVKKYKNRQIAEGSLNR